MAINYNRLSIHLELEAASYFQQYIYEIKQIEFNAMKYIQNHVVYYSREEFFEPGGV